MASPSLGGAFTGLKLGRSFRGLGRADSRTVLRVLPMAVADFVAEAFEDDLLRATIAARGVVLTAMGPWSAGTTAVLLADSAGNDGGAAGQAVFARGGPGALSAALVGSIVAAGGEVWTGAEVASISERSGRAVGVVLASGEQLAARTVVAAVDPKRLLTGLTDPVTLGPVSWRAANIRMPGTVAKVNLALAGLPAFAAASGDDDGPRLLRGRIAIGPGIDAIERAFDASKYGAISEHPFLEATIPSLVDPGLVEGASLGRRRGAAHVMSVTAQWMPYRLREATGTPTDELANPSSGS
jgi:phytoene dehydrogenase-like protein